MTIGVLIGLSFAILWGLQLVAFKKTLEHTSASVCFIFYTITALPVWIPFGLWQGLRFDYLGEVFLVAFMSAALSEAYVNFALSYGSITIASTLFSTFPVMTLFFARVFLGERIQGASAVAVAAVILGIMLVSLPRDRSAWRGASLSGILFPLSAAAAAAFSDTISKGVLDRSNLGTFLFALALGQIPVSLIFHRLECGRYPVWQIRSFSFNKYWPLIFAAISNAALLILFWAAYNSLYASIAAPVTATYAVFVAIFARIFLGEKLQLKDYAGMIIIAAAMAWLST